MQHVCGTTDIPGRTEHRYGLTYGFTPDRFQDLLDKMDDLLSTPDCKKEWQAKRERMLKDKINLAGWMVKFIEGNDSFR